MILNGITNSYYVFFMVFFANIDGKIVFSLRSDILIAA